MQGLTSSYVITRMLAAPATALLTTLANVKDELSITDASSDMTLNRLIGEESAKIARHCNRIFGLATWQDEFRPQRGVRGEGVRQANNPLLLSKYPLANGAAVVITGNTHSSVVVDGIASTAGITAGMIVAAADGSIPAGTTVRSVSPYSINLSKATTSSVTGQLLSAGMNVIETVASTAKWLEAGTDYEIELGTLLPGDEGVGRVYRLNEQGNPKTWPAGIIQVQYQAGYSLPNDACPTPNFPADLQSVCIRLVVGRFKARGRDPALAERSQPGGIGMERWWIGSSPGQRGPYPNDIMDALDAYRTPVVA